MLFNVVPQDFFLAPAQRVDLTPRMRCRRQNPELELLRQLGLAPVLRKGEGCPNWKMSRECCLTPGMKKEAECKESIVKPGEKQTTVEKASLNFRGFSPEQIKVKVADKLVIVRGEQKNGHTNVQITKTMPIPEGADRKGIVCRYEDGHVSVHIPVIQQKPLEIATGKGDEKAELKDQLDMETRRKAEFEKSVKTLTDLFSTVFGLPLDGSTEQGESGAEEKKNGAQTTEKCEEEKCEEEKCEAKACSSTHTGDDEHTFVMTVCRDETKRHDEDDFVHVEQHEADDKHLGSEEDSFSELVTSLISDVTGDDEVERSTVLDEAEDDDKVKDVKDVITAVADESTKKAELAAAKDFKLELDLSNFKPENTRVVFKDGDVIVEAEREIKGENYSEIENVRRCIRVPENVDESMLKSYLSEEGLLTIEAPHKKCGDSKWRVIKVELED